MFDVSFSELLMIGVIALIVIGPERLPKVARTIGHLVGRAQRYVSDVKTDIQREMDLDEITNIKDQLEDASNTIKKSVHDAGKQLREPLDEAQDALKQAGESLKELDHEPAGEPLVGTVERPLEEPAALPEPPPKHTTETPT